MQDDRMNRETWTIAGELWERDGRPAGKNREHWEAAKEAWAFRQREAQSNATDMQASPRSEKRVVRRPDGAAPAQPGVPRTPASLS